MLQMTMTEEACSVLCASAGWAEQRRGDLCAFRGHAGIHLFFFPSSYKSMLIILCPSAPCRLKPVSRLLHSLYQNHKACYQHVLSCILFPSISEPFTDLAATSVTGHAFAWTAIGAPILWSCRSLLSPMPYLCLCTTPIHLCRAPCSLPNDGEDKVRAWTPRYSV